MKKLQTFLFIGLLVLVLSGCSKDIKSVSSEAAEAINVSEYFPPIGMTKTYFQYGAEGEKLESIETVNLSVNSDGPDTVYTHNTGGLVTDTMKEYIVSEESLRNIYVVNVTRKEEVDVVELANKPEWDKNDPDKSVSYMTATDLTMEVPAGKYDNVIEVTTVIPDDIKGRKTMHYYAPEVGLIKTVFVFEDGDEFTFSELKSAEMMDE